MNDGQKKMLSLLEKFDELCAKYGITYYLGGGTALGAVRNGGFLPWDDDTDIYITRDNYLKLLDVQNVFFDDDFVLVNSQKFPRYGNTLARCIDTKSTAFTKSRIADNAPKGQFLELFILDPMPKEERAQAEWRIKHWIYAELLSTSFIVANNRICKWTNKEIYYKYIEKCNTIGKEEVLKQLEGELFTIPESDAKEYCARWGLRQLIYDIDWFQEPRYIPFENIELPVAKNVERVLRFDYGDNWMYIPEEDKQRKHDIIQNMDISYKNYVNDYTQFIDIDEIFSSYDERKKRQMDYWFAHLEANDFRRNLKEIQVITSLKFNISSVQDLNLLAENGKFDKLKELFSTWYNNQFSDLFWSTEVCINIDDKLLYFAVLPMLIQGGYSKIRTLLLWRQKTNDLSPELQILLNYTEAIRNIYIALDEKYDCSDTEIESLLDADSIKAFPFCDQQYDYNKFKIMFGLKNTRNDEIEVLENACENMLKDYPNDGELLALYGDIKWKFNEHEDAIAFYTDAYKKTRNSFVLKHIANRMNLSSEEGG